MTLQNILTLNNKEHWNNENKVTYISYISYNLVLHQFYLSLQIFEWWYFKKYGTSFIEQVSLNHISPLLGGAEGQPTENNNTNTTSNNTTTTQNQQTQQSMPGEAETQKKLNKTIKWNSWCPMRQKQYKYNTEPTNKTVYVRLDIPKHVWSKIETNN